MSPREFGATDVSRPAGLIRAMRDTGALRNNEQLAESVTDLPKLRSVAPRADIDWLWVPLTWAPGQCCFCFNVFFTVWKRIGISRLLNNRFEYPPHLDSYWTCNNAPFRNVLGICYLLYALKVDPALNDVPFPVYLVVQSQLLALCRPCQTCLPFWCFVISPVLTREHSTFHLYSQSIKEPWTIVMDEEIDRIHIN